MSNSLEEAWEEGFREGYREGLILGSIHTARQLGLPEDQIQTSMMEEYRLSEEAYADYLSMLAPEEP